MGTRATYQFKGSEKSYDRGTHTVYVHWDGYPEGAATYFYETLCKPSKGNLATQFIRAVEHAQLTESHDAHGDTEFHYELVGEGTEAVVIAYRIDFDSRKHTPFFHGKLIDFVERYKKMIEGYSRFRPVEGPYSTAVLNAKTAALRLGGEHGILWHLRVWAKNGACKPDSANWIALATELRNIIAEFPDLRTEEIDALLSL